MYTQSHSRFDIKKFNEMVVKYNEEEPKRGFSQVVSYEDFCNKYPLSDRKDLHKISEQLIEGGKLKGCYVVSTSGTTSTPILMANRIWRKSSEDSYPTQFYNYVAENVFTPSDVIANLFFPGGFGLLYEGACRFLEPIGGTILPVGRLDSFENNHSHFSMFQRLCLNALIGTPASIIEFAQASLKAGVKLNIKKLIFSGESFYPAKREYIRNIWPDAEFYSLYGATECGLVAVETPKDQESLHFIFEDWFMLEEGIDGSLYVTDLKEPLIPIIRYCIGDKGQLIKMKDGTTKLLLKGRNDTSFNCGGALIQHESIVKKIRNISEMANLGEDDVQIILKNGENGKDILKIVVNHDASNKPDMIYKIRDMVCSIKEISEDVNRGAVELLVNGPLNLIITRRNKTPQIIDYRHKR